MAGRSDEDLRELITTIRIIKILYQSNPWPERGSSRNSTRNKRRRWRSRQRQIDQIAGRILASRLGRPEEPGGADLPDLSRLHIGDQGPPNNPVDTPGPTADQRA
ncbi:rev protein [Human immunodeficiency virus 1]|uniref:Protein Rev n=1 Tax=Human immunodeficiency virus type 1 TaxID=11676 RepID=C7EYS6_HV1|nr:rev protein [Human immunodeficiency virus 1]ACY40657.1 rev protein [Human immunodeficiency virus 1]ATZ77199.1 rev protein [Human immunodeficiency virus 1]